MTINEILNIKKQLQQPFKGENKAEKHHFQVGRQLHTSNYYYDRYYFEILENSRMISKLLVEKLLQPPFNLDEVTLIGVGNYCAPLLKDTVIGLEKEHLERNKKAITVNYAILNNTTKELSFLFAPVIHKNVIIILPLTHTYSRCFEFEELLYKNINQYVRGPGKDNTSFYVVPEYISVFLIADNLLKISRKVEGQEYPLASMVAKRKNQRGNLEKIVSLYSSFGWKSITSNKVYFATNQPYTNHSATFLMHFETNVYFGEKCQYCFPTNPAKEKVLFPIRNQYDIPNLIFNLPQFKNTGGTIFTEDFSAVFERHEDPGHLFGHLRVDHYSFLHYIQRDRFYENNKPAIHRFFKDQIEYLFPDLATSEGKVLIVSPINQNASTLLEELVAVQILPADRTSIIYTDPNNEYLENFLSNNSADLMGFTTILYFDYVISIGKTFKQISDYLKNARGEDRGFDAVFTVTDRTTDYSKREILRKIGRLEKDKERFVAFFKLNLPLIDATNSGNPINETNLLLRELFPYCQLDALKQTISRKISKGRPLNLVDLKKDNSLYPTVQRQRYLMKLRISHEASNWFYSFIHQKNYGKKLREIQFSISDLKDLIKDIIVVVRKDENAADKEDITQIVIKTFSHAPYKLYENIYLSTFEYVKEKLEALTDQLAQAGFLISGQDHLKQLNFYLKRSVELNANFILSKRFFTTLRGIFENEANFKDSAGPHMFDMLLIFKRLIFKDPARSIRLESLINSTEFLPRPLQDANSSIDETLADRYYMLGRLMKAENNYILHQLKDLFLEHLEEGLLPDDHSAELTKVKQYIQDHYLSNNYDSTNKRLRNLQSFLKSSKEMLNSVPGRPDETLPESLCQAIACMLATVYRLERSESEGESFINNARAILREASNILAPDLDFAFCIEYRELKRVPYEHGRPGMTAKNIYTILSSESDAAPELTTNGLIYHMLHGINEGDSASLQTFIATVIGESNTVQAFRGNFTTNDPGWSKNELEPFDVSSAFGNDITEKANGVIGKGSRMSLIFRLADIDIARPGSHKGQAVLVITSKEPVSTESFCSFLNLEKIRLLLVIKEKLMDYLKRQFENDAFIGLLSNRKKLEYKNSMEHMLSHYFSAMESVLDNDRRLKEVDKPILNFLANKIQRHVLSIGQGGDKESRKYIQPDIIEYSRQQVEELLEQVMTVPYLARMPLILHLDRKQEINITEPIRCESVIFEQVITEIMINMRRYSIDVEGYKRVIRIEQKGNLLIFENPFNPKFNPEPKTFSASGGKQMCNNILKTYNLNPLLEQQLEGDYFRVTLDLTPIEE